MFTKENIGETHPEFDHTVPNFTQVIVRWDGEKIAQFMGAKAKLIANRFVRNMQRVGD